MSLQKKCQDLKAEIYQLKKKAKAQPPTTKKLPYYKELDKIVFGENSSTNERHYFTACNLPLKSENTKIDESNWASTPNQALAYNSTCLRDEIRDIKRMGNVPEGFKSPFVNRKKDNLENTISPSKYSSLITASENGTLQRNLLSNARTIKKHYSDEDKILKIQNSIKENFSETANRIYNEKKSSNIAKMKELIQRKREIVQ